MQVAPSAAALANIKVTGQLAGAVAAMGGLFVARTSMGSAPAEQPGTSAGIGAAMIGGSLGGVVLYGAGLGVLARNGLALPARAEAFMRGGVVGAAGMGVIAGVGLLAGIGERAIRS